MTTTEAIPTATAEPDEVSEAPSETFRHGATPHAYDLGLLLLRLVLGLTIAAHGAQKLLGWFGGFGLKGTGAFFTQSGYPHGHLFAIVAGVTEGAGGLGLALGLLTPIAGAAVFGTMVNAMAVIWTGLSAKGFFAPTGIEYPLLITAGAAALTLTGPGRYAADHVLPVLRRHKLYYGVLMLVVGAALAAATLAIRK